MEFERVITESREAFEEFPFDSESLDRTISQGKIEGEADFYSKMAGFMYQQWHNHSEMVPNTEGNAQQRCSEEAIAHETHQDNLQAVDGGFSQCAARVSAMANPSGNCYQYGRRGSGTSGLCELSVDCIAGFGGGRFNSKCLLSSSLRECGLINSNRDPP